MNFSNILKEASEPILITEAVAFDRTFGEVGGKIAELIKDESINEKGGSVENLSIKDLKTLYTELSPTGKNKIAKKVFRGDNKFLSKEEKQIILDIFIERKLLSSLGIKAENEVSKKNYDIVKGNVEDPKGTDVYIVNQKNIVDYFSQKGSELNEDPVELFINFLKNSVKIKNKVIKFSERQEDYIKAFFNYKKNKIPTNKFFVNLLARSIDGKEKLTKVMDDSAKALTREIKGKGVTPKADKKVISYYDFFKKYKTVDAFKKDLGEILHDFGSEGEIIYNLISRTANSFFDNISRDIVRKKADKDYLNSRTLKFFKFCEKVINNSKIKEKNKLINDLNKIFNGSKSPKLRSQSVDIKAGEFARITIPFKSRFLEYFKDYSKNNSEENKTRLKKEFLKIMNNVQKENKGYISYLLAYKDKERIILKKQELGNFFDKLSVDKNAMTYKTNTGEELRVFNFETANKIALNLKNLYKIGKLKETKAIRVVSNVKI